MNGKDEFLLDGCDEQKKNSVHAVISAYRSLLTPISYVSMPITTGKLYYEVLDKMGSVLTKDQVYDQIIRPNGERGLDFAQSIEGLPTFPVVAPAIFEAKQMRWTEREYMYLWYRILEEKAREIWMSPGWQYSNGCSEEFTRAMKIQWDFVRLDPTTEDEPLPIRAYDALGNELNIYDGTKLVFEAIVDLKDRGHDCPKLIECLHELVNYAGVYYTYGKDQGWVCPHEVDYEQMAAWSEQIRSL